MTRLLVAVKPFVAPLCILSSFVLLILDAGGAAAAVSLFGCGWITYGIVDTVERISARRARRRAKWEEARRLYERGIITCPDEATHVGERYS